MLKVWYFLQILSTLLGPFIYRASPFCFISEESSFDVDHLLFKTVHIFLTVLELTVQVSFRAGPVTQ